MSPVNTTGTRAVFTAGFSNLPLARFLDNLRTYEIQTLVDVRSRPFAAYTPHFNKEHIEHHARTAGLCYRYMGKELGGQPDDPDFYDAKGYVLYSRIARQPWFQSGIGQVLDELHQGRRLALVCGEEDPRHCHRRLLLGRVLRERGVGVAHILGHGGVISEAELVDEENLVPRQARLYGDPAEPEWKSTRALFRNTPSGRASNS